MVTDNPLIIYTHLETNQGLQNEQRKLTFAVKQDKP